MVSNPFYSRYRSSVDASHLQTSFGISSNTGMAGFIANIVDVGGLRRRSSSSSRYSVSDDHHKRPSLLRNQATVEPSIGTHKESVSRSPSLAGRTRTATDILSRVVVVSTQHPEFTSPIGSPTSSCGPQSPTSEARSPKDLSGVTTDDHSGMNNVSISLSDAYFSFPRFGSWNGEDKFDCEGQQAEL